MADLLSTSVSGLLAFRRALDATSHNIANVGTEGYSRQRTELATREAQPYGNGWIGSGVQVTTVRRVYDEFLAQQVRTAAGGFERFQAYASQAQRVSNLFADSTAGIAAALQRFGNAIQDLASAPGSIPARQVMLSEANSLAARLQHYDAQLASIDREIQARVAGETEEVAGLARALARLNGEIANGLARTGQPPNDLLDERDRVLDQLSARLNVSTVARADGMIDVFVGNGQALVLGIDSAQLATRAEELDASRRTVVLRTTLGEVDIAASLTGGSLGGLLDVRREVLDPARNELGRISAGLAATVNAQHRAGLDLTGALGQDLFAIGGVDTFAHAANAGNATLAVTRADVSALTGADYLLEYTAGGWQLREQATGAGVTLAGSGTTADPLRGAGLEIVVGAGARIGDRFLVRPTRGATAGLDVLIGDPARIAAAAPIRTAAAASNTGGAQISAGEVVDAADPQLRTSVTIEFLTPTTYSIDGAGSFAYTSGAPIEINGWRVSVSGAPAAGDRFTVRDNAGGVGDNRNALRLAESLSRPLLDGGSTSLDAAAGRLVGSVGVATRQAQMNADAQRIVHADGLEARDGVSGVNLDEEAANLLRFQQAYQAAAQLIRVASTMFDTLLAATRR